MHSNALYALAKKPTAGGSMNDTGNYGFSPRICKKPFVFRHTSTNLSAVSFSNEANERTDAFVTSSTRSDALHFVYMDARMRSLIKTGNILIIQVRQNRKKKIMRRWSHRNANATHGSHIRNVYLYSHDLQDAHCPQCCACTHAMCTLHSIKPNLFPFFSLLIGGVCKVRPWLVTSNRDLKYRQNRCFHLSSGNFCLLSTRYGIARRCKFPSQKSNETQITRLYHTSLHPKRKDAPRMQHASDLPHNLEGQVRIVSHVRLPRNLSFPHQP